MSNRVDVDNGREAVYAAENAAFEGTSFESLVPLVELSGLAGAITAAAWWPHGPIDVVAARSDARSSSTRACGDATPVVRLAGPQMTPATLIHEFAHVLAGVTAGHGPMFRRAHVDLVNTVFGSDAGNWLVDAYNAMGLDLGERAWSSPSPVTAAAARLSGIGGEGFLIV